MLNKLVNSVEFSLALTKRDIEAVVKATLQNLAYLLPEPSFFLPSDTPEDVAYIEGWNAYHKALLGLINEHQ